MAYTKNRLLAAVAKVVGVAQVESLGLPRATEEAAIIHFLDQSEDETEASLVREALTDLRSIGSFQFSEPERT